ncbi:MAG: PqqD family protein [Thomasclavelia sp.]
MENELKFIARKGFVVREIAGEYMLVPMDTGTIRLSDGTTLPEFNGIIELNELGLFLFNTLSSPQTFNQLVEAVKQEYDTSNQDITADINEFLDRGLKNQVIFISTERNEKGK